MLELNGMCLLWQFAGVCGMKETVGYSVKNLEVMWLCLLLLILA